MAHAAGPQQRQLAQRRRPSRAFEQRRAKKMSSSSASALVTAGWLMPAAARPRASANPAGRCRPAGADAWASRLPSRAPSQSMPHSHMVIQICQQIYAQLFHAPILAWSPASGATGMSSFTARPEIRGTFGVVSVHALARLTSRHGRAGTRRQRLRRRGGGRLRAADSRAAPERPRRRGAYPVLERRRAAHARAMRPGTRARAGDAGLFP